MVILDLEVIDLNGAFQNFVLDLLDNDIVTIDQYQNVNGSEFAGFGPALDQEISGI